MIQAIIFDLDGLLSDTERLHRKAYRTTLANHGVELTDAVYDEHWVRLGKGIGDFTRERKLSFDPDALRAEKAAIYDRLVREEVEPMPGALELLERVSGRFKLALATSSFADAAECVLEVLDIRRYFAVVVTGCVVRHVKPDPEIFLLAARKLAVPPENCVVFEDSEKGVRAARAAGMACIAVPNEHTRDHDFSDATLVLPSLSAVSIERIAALRGH